MLNNEMTNKEETYRTYRAPAQICVVLCVFCAKVIYAVIGPLKGGLTCAVPFRVCVQADPKH